MDSRLRGNDGKEGEQFSDSYPHSNIKPADN